MAIAGLRGTGDWATDERPKNFREMILWRNPSGQAPLTALLSKMKSEKTDDPEFAWYEEELNALRLTVNYNTGYSTTDNTIVVTSNVTSAEDCVAGDVLMVEKALLTTFDNEIVVVSSVTDATTIVVKRAQANTTGAPLANATKLTKIGNVFGEGTGAPSASTRNPTKLYNLTQIFKTVYEITNTAKQTKTRTGDPIKNDKKRKMFDHSVALEMAFLFGKRHETTGSNGKPLRYTGGLLWFLSQYASSMITPFTTTPTESTFLDAVYKVFDYNSDGSGDERIVFAGNGALNSLNKLAKNSTSTRINFNGIVNVYGMKLQSWTLPQGTLYVKTHPLFNTHGRFTNDMLIIDPSALKYRHMRDTTFKDNIQGNDEDTTKGQWLTEAGLEVEHAKTMGYISNFIVP
jgi:hypothetical protein